MIARASAYISLYSILFLLLFLGGCGPRYQKHAFDEIAGDTLFVAHNENILINLHQLTESQAHRLFDGRGHRLYRGKSPLYAIVLCITNKREHAIYLNQNQCSVPLVNNEAIAKRLHTNTCMRVLTIATSGIVAASVMFFGAAYITLCGVVAAIPALIKAGYITLAASGVFFFGAPFWAMTHGRFSAHANHSISCDVQEKNIKEQLCIEPGQEYQVLIFVEQKDFKEQIIFNFQEQETEKKIAIAVSLVQEEIA